MAKILTFEIPENEAQQLEVSIDKLISEMRSSREKMYKDQEEIDFLKAETRKVAFETQKIIAQLKTQWLNAA